MQVNFIRHIDDGGFGHVDEVEIPSGQRFARKTFAKNQPLDDALLENVLKRFRKEARIQKSIKSRNIVPVVADALDNDPPYFLMPVADSSLARDLAQDRTLAGNFAAALSDIAAGLEELHAMQIYHRDLKPQNVLRFNDGNGSFYAIGDFGLISMKESRLSTLTKTGMKMGSDYYTAPEITKDLRSASVQSDIYSLGCILHEMVGTEDRVPCGEIREQGPYSTILLGCTRKDPKQRFKSARAVLDAVISVGIPGSQPSTRKAIDFVNALEGTDPISDGTWKQLADYLEYEAADAERRSINVNLSSERIEEVCQRSIESADIIASQFAEWVEHSAFGFEYCDGLSNRLETFFEHCNFESKCKCLLAILELGTSHNRWYVERKFFRLCGQSMDENLAKRFALELRIVGASVCHSIDHLERSIGVSRHALHGEIAKALVEICV